MPNLANLPVADLQAGTANWSGQGYIDGLKMMWNSATSLSVTSGSAFIPASNKNIQLAATATLSGLVLTASTWYHVYLYLNAGTPAIECVNTAPSAPYNGTARAKTGDTSRRYVGSVKTDASGNIFNFLHSGSRIAYLVGQVQFPGLRILSNGTATTATQVSASATVPLTSVIASMRFINLATAGSIEVSNSQASTTIPSQYGLISMNSSTQAFALFPLASDQSLTYAYGSAPTGGGMYMDVNGYEYER